MTNKEAIIVLKNIAWFGKIYDQEQTEEAVDMAINALTAQPEPCEDAVSRQAILNYKCDCYDSEDHLLYAVPTGYILRMPSVHPERKKGKWIIDHLCSTTGGTYQVIRCSLCGHSEPWRMGENKFCPNCGADMREGQDD